MYLQPLNFRARRAQNCNEKFTERFEFVHSEVLGKELP